MSKREYIHILLRILILVFMILASVWTILQQESPVRISFAVGFTLLAIIELFSYLLRWRKRIQAVLVSFEAGDPTGVPVENDLLASSLLRISDRIRATRSSGEANQIYLDLLVRHLEVAVLCLDDRNKVVLANDSFFELADAGQARRLTPKFWDRHWLAPVIQAFPSSEQASETVSNNQKFYSVRHTSFILEGRSFRLVTIADIDSELKRKEQQAWQELLGILTHEIMNSIAPVSSLSQSLEERMSQTDPGEYPSDWLAAVQAIRNRSSNLLRFSEDYRRLSRLPDPDLQEVSLMKVTGRLIDLFLARNSSIQIALSLEVDNIIVDEAMLEQVLVNLIKNAIEAMEGSDYSIIEISSHSDLRGLQIAVSNKGPEIPFHLQEKIFRPFFSTKEKGSGIGLSLCRQIMLSHGGDISLMSSDGETRFILHFPIKSLLTS